jgi:hypothetical protein
MSQENNENQLNQSQLEVISDKEIREARFKLWHMGELQWKFTITQQKIYDFYNTVDNKTIVLNCSRRLGKTYLLCLMAIEQSIKYPNSIVKFLMPEIKMIRTNLRPIMHEIFFDAPRELVPRYNTQDSIYKFNNGSEIHLAGSDNGNYDKLRGGNCHLAIVDEAGFCSDLNHIIKYILTPTTLLTKGRIILSSTTPPNPDHEFIKIMQRAEASGNLIRKTIFDARDDDKGSSTPRITDEIIADVIKDEEGGEQSDAFRTEYLCEVIFNSDDAVLPEFNTAVQRETICEWHRPAFCDRYVSMDIGFVDLTVVLFGFWDFDNGVLVIEDELVINGPEMTTKRLAEKIIQRENLLWTNALTGEFEKPYIRVSDNNLILINDLQRDHALTFFPTDKHNKDAYIGKLRNMVRDHQIIVNPRCTTLISHMKLATWDRKKTGTRDFARSGDKGHFDAVAALMYMVRNVQMDKNPYPKGFRASKMIKNSGVDNIFVNPNFKDISSGYEDFEDLFKPKTSYKKK